LSNKNGVLVTTKVRQQVSYSDRARETLANRSRFRLKITIATAARALSVRIRSYYLCTVFVYHSIMFTWIGRI